MKNTPWIGVDLDGTLAEQGGSGNLFESKFGFRQKIGAMIPLMKERIEGWLAKEIEVRIFTARVAGDRLGVSPEDNMLFIQDYLEHNGLPRLQVTAVKDFFMLELYDDRAVQVEFNTGRLLGQSTMHHRQLLKK